MRAHIKAIKFIRDHVSEPKCCELDEEVFERVVSAFNNRPKNPRYDE